MANTGIKNKILGLSPYIEIFIRKVYWNNINLISKYTSKNIRISNNFTDFDKILKYLETEGIGNGNLMILHSSFEPLEGTKLTPMQVINKLLEFLGKEGTLAMNSARKFKEEAGVKEYLTKDYKHTTTTYDVKQTKVWTGVLPFFLVRHPDSVISEFPLNPMVAIGKLSKDMMENNLKGNLISCGTGSSWEFCVNNNAVVVGVGIDLTHSLTIMHVAEEVNPESWPIADWFRTRKFLIINNNQKKEVTVRERKPKWGALYFAERTLCKDLIKEKILKTTNIDGVQVEYLHATKLIDFLNKKNSKGYPYFGISKKYIK
ncbi:MAG TPA: AAC(3) family N-acetyltransferase [Flavobacterium sp.]